MTDTNKDNTSEPTMDSEVAIQPEATQEKEVAQEGQQTTPSYATKDEFNKLTQDVIYELQDIRAQFSNKKSSTRASSAKKVDDDNLPLTRGDFRAVRSRDKKDLQLRKAESLIAEGGNDAVYADALKRLKKSESLTGSDLKELETLIKEYPILNTVIVEASKTNRSPELRGGDYKLGAIPRSPLTNGSVETRQNTNFVGYSAKDLDKLDSSTRKEFNDLVRDGLVDFANARMTGKSHKASKALQRLLG